MFDNLDDLTSLISKVEVADGEAPVRVVDDLDELNRLVSAQGTEHGLDPLNELLSAQGKEPDLVGTWVYGTKATEYRVLPGLRFDGPHQTFGRVSGMLGPRRGYPEWLVADLRSPQGENAGSIRLRLNREDGTMTSNYKGVGKSAWGSGIIATKKPSGLREPPSSSSGRLSVRSFVVEKQYQHEEEKWAAGDASGSTSVGGGSQPGAAGDADPVRPGLEEEDERMHRAWQKLMVATGRRRRPEAEEESRPPPPRSHPPPARGVPFYMRRPSAESSSGSEVEDLPRSSAAPPRQPQPQAPPRTSEPPSRGPEKASAPAPAPKAHANGSSRDQRGLQEARAPAPAPAAASAPQARAPAPAPQPRADDLGREQRGPAKQSPPAPEPEPRSYGFGRDQRVAPERVPELGSGAFTRGSGVAPPTAARRPPSDNLISSLNATIKLIEAKKILAVMFKGGVKVREGFSLDSRLLGRYPDYTIVEILEQDGGRLHVQKCEGEGPDEGWVSAKISGKPVFSLIGSLKEMRELQEAALLQASKQR